MVVGLKASNGVWHTKDEDVTGIISNYFADLFSTSRPAGVKVVLDCMQSKVTSEMNVTLCKPYTHEEVNRALL